MSRLEIAQQFIKDRNLKSAQEVLSTMLTPETVKVRSLLYRYNDQYDEEFNLLKTAKQTGIMAEYLDKRLSWHALDMFNKCEPRQSLVLPKNPKQLPLTSTIDQTCFVTGGDSKYYQHLVETIESLRSCQSYNQHPIIVIDGGLTDDQKNELQQKYQSIILQVDFDLEFNELKHVNRTTPSQPYTEPKLDWHKILVFKPFIKKYLPQYKFYIWVDGDAWIQDEQCIDRLLVLTEKQGIAVGEHQVCKFCKDHPWHRCGILPVVDEEFLDQKIRIISSLFCIDRDSPILDAWQAYMKVAVEKQGYWYNTEEMTLNYVIHKMGITEFLTHEEHFGLCLGIPLIRDNGQTLLSPKNFSIIGSFHLGGRCKNYFLYPTMMRDKPFQPQEYQSYLQHFMDRQIFAIVDKLNCLPHQINFGIQNQASVSCHYRVLPWKEKNTLLKEIALCR